MKERKSLLLAEVEDGQTVDLVRWCEALQQLSNAIKRRSGDAHAELVARLETGRMAAYRLTGPDQYAEAGSGATMWWPPAALLQFANHAAATSLVRRFGPAVAHEAWGYLNRPGQIAKVLPVLESGPTDRPLVGPAGLAAMLRAAARAGAAAAAALPRGVELAVRRDQLQALIAELSPRPLDREQPAPSAALPAPASGADSRGWSAARLHARQCELKQQQHRAPTKQLALESGLHERDIQRQLKKFKADTQAHAKLAGVLMAATRRHA